MTDEELKKRLTEFVKYFELVFDVDWEFSKGCMNDKWKNSFIASSGTFLAPSVADESDNWHNRGSLLASYRELLEAMKEQGIHESTES